MNILYLTQYFFTPDQAGGSRHFYHVKYLRSRGHRVDVITSYVQDHMSREIPKEYRGKICVRESYQGIAVYKTYATAHYDQSFFARMKNYFSFMFCALIVGLRIKGRYDLVFASSPSLFVGLAGYILAKCKRGKFVLEVRDLWPRSAIVLGFLKNPLFIAWAQWLEKLLYRKAAVVVALTRGIKDAVSALVRDLGKVKLITNGVDPDLFLNPKPFDFAQNPGLAGKFIALYVGAHGANNDLETIIDAADQLRDHPEIRFVLIGGGDRKPALREICARRGLQNVCFLPPRPKSVVPSYLAGADACLLTIKKDPFFQGTLPNKLFDYLAGGKPIAAAVPPEGESGRLVRELDAGIVCAPENGAELARAILQIYEKKNLFQAAGSRARIYALEYFSRYRLAAQLEEALREAGKKIT